MRRDVLTAVGTEAVPVGREAGGHSPNGRSADLGEKQSKRRRPTRAAATSGQAEGSKAGHPIGSSVPHRAEPTRRTCPRANSWHSGNKRASSGCVFSYLSRVTCLAHSLSLGCEARPGAWKLGREGARLATPADFSSWAPSLWFRYQVSGLGQGAALQGAHHGPHVPLLCSRKSPSQDTECPFTRQAPQREPDHFFLWLCLWEVVCGHSESQVTAARTGK